MSRRAALGLAFVVVLGPMALPANSQPRGSIPRVALLCAVWCEALQSFRHEEGQAFVHALGELGHIDGQTVIADERGAGIKSGLTNVTSELVRRKVDIIVAEGLPGAQAAMKATTPIPIVMVGVADPVRLGLVPSLARPGGNVTGVAVPFVVTVRLLQRRSRTQADLEGIVSTLDREGSRALLVLHDPHPQAYEGVNLLALRYRVATISTKRDIARGGGLLAYGSDRLETVRRAAYFVDRILRGTKSGDLPVEEPTRMRPVMTERARRVARFEGAEREAR